MTTKIVLTEKVGSRKAGTELELDDQSAGWFVDRGQAEVVSTSKRRSRKAKKTEDASGDGDQGGDGNGSGGEGDPENDGGEQYFDADGNPDPMPPGNASRDAAYDWALRHGQTAEVLDPLSRDEILALYKD